MAILAFQFDFIGEDGVSPRLCRMETNDTLAQITTAGFLNGLISQGNAIYPNDVFFISYGTNSQTSGQFSVSVSNGVYTLSLAESGVILPTIPNHIATYTNTSGTLSEDPATAISGGNIQAGLSGTLASFPATVAKGSLVIAAVANTGNTLVTLSNVAHGQASVYSIPDAGNAVGRILNAATATPFTTGHLPAASGTGGLMVDSGLATSNVMANNITNTFTSSGRLIANKVNGTEASNAVTASGMAGFITTSDLTTAAGGSYAITWTNTFITATSVVLLSVEGGNNSGTTNLNFQVVPGTGTATLTIYNNDPAVALAGTLVIGYLVM